MSDIEVVFTANQPGNKAFGYGTIKVAGISINYSVYPSPYNLGIMLNLPSHRSMKDGVPQMKDGKPLYINDVYIADPALRIKIDEAVLNAMYNKGIRVTPGIPYTKPATSGNFTPASNTFEQRSTSVPTTPVVPVVAERPTFDDDLPF